MPGRYFDEWQIGDSVEHAITRTVTETDNLLMSTLTHNPQPMHLDIEAAKASEFGQILVNSCFTFSLVVGVSVAEVRFPKPVFYGDTLKFESECLELRESKSRPNAGIVTWEHRATNQRGEVVCTMKRTALLQKTPQ